MLKWSGLFQIVITTLLITAAVSAATVLALRVARGRASLALQYMLVLAGFAVSIATSTVAVAAEMYLSGHDLVVLYWVIGIAALMSMPAIWLVTARSLRTSIDLLIGDARRVGDGDVIDPAATGWAELDSVSAELSETSQRLADARAQIAELDAARAQFFAWISHDLRTPLAGMRAMAEALEAGTAPDPLSYARIIRTKVDTVNQMVGDLFELSRLQTGTIDLRPEPVALLDLVSDAVVDVQALAGERGIVIEQDGIAGHLIWADPRELTRAVGNLLVNSVRHAPRDSTVLVRADTTDDSRLVLSVIDQGPGVAAENLGHMFDIGWRADSARSNESHQGAGLGLAIVRGIVEAHGGSVRASQGDSGFQLDMVLPNSGGPDTEVVPTVPDMRSRRARCRDG